MQRLKEKKWPEKYLLNYVLYNMVITKSNNSCWIQYVYFQHFMNLNYKCYNANGEQVIEEGKKKDGYWTVTFRDWFCQRWNFKFRQINDYSTVWTVMLKSSLKEMDNTFFCTSKCTREENVSFSIIVHIIPEKWYHNNTYQGSKLTFQSTCNVWLVPVRFFPLGNWWDH